MVDRRAVATAGLGAALVVAATAAAGGDPADGFSKDPAAYALFLGVLYLLVGLLTARPSRPSFRGAVGRVLLALPALVCVGAALAVADLSAVTRRVTAFEAPPLSVVVLDRLALGLLVLPAASGLLVGLADGPGQRLAALAVAVGSLAWAGLVLGLTMGAAAAPLVAFAALAGAAGAVPLWALWRSDRQ